MSDDNTPSLKRRLGTADAVERAEILDGLPYEVGYGKPPKHGRFTSERQPKRGRQSKRPQNFFEIMQAELAGKVPVKEAGKMRRLTKWEVMAKQFVNKAAAGNDKAMQRLLDMIESGQLKLQPTFDPAKARAEVAAVMKRIAAQFGAKKTKEDNEDET